MQDANAKTKSTSPKQLLRRQPVQRRAEKTKLKIVDAAQKTLGENGIAGFSMRQIARAAGTSVGSVYEYFPSKQVLLFWVAEQRLNQRLVVFDSVSTADNLKLPLNQLIQRYLKALRNAGLYSRIDLEIRVAEERDPQLEEYMTRYKSELTKRYIKVWRHYGSTHSTDRLTMLAQYSHELDLVSMKLQLAGSQDDQAKIWFIAEELVRVLVDIAMGSASDLF